MPEEKYLVSEIFGRTIQGEGKYNGVPTSWVRFFGCNLSCLGFGQIDPTNPETYILPYKEFDTRSVNRVEDLPVWEYGCDSSYSHAKEYKHFQHQLTAEEICSRLRDSMRSKFNPEGKFVHPHSGFRTHLCFTGGEPFLPKNQRGITDILNCLFESGDYPEDITFETNGTKTLTEPFKEFLEDHMVTFFPFFSVSPKLYTVSGELNEKAIKPDVIASYTKYGDGQLKFVMGAEERQWDELERVISQIRAEGVLWDVWIMPVGATEEGQEGKYGGHPKAGDVANLALERGYHVADRTHVRLFGNIIGV